MAFSGSVVIAWRCQQLRMIDYISIDKVGCVFGSTVALRGTSARLGTGTLHLFCGPNGSGKTTLLRVIAGLVAPTTGAVKFEPNCQRSEVSIGFVSHDAMVYGGMTVRENLVFRAKVLGLDLVSAWEGACERFGLRMLAERSVHVLSRGQRQRVSLACALVGDPDIMLLDEPSTGLDSVGVTALLETLALEVERGAICIVVAHDPGTFQALNPTTWGFQQGRIALEKKSR